MSPVAGTHASPTVSRLRRLRVSLTVLFTAALALGLLVLAVLVLHKDSDLRRESLESEMSRRVTASSRLLYYSGNGELRLNGVRGDDVTTGKPEIRVMAGTGRKPHLVFESDGPHLPLSYADLASISRRAARDEKPVSATVTDRRGRDVRLVAGPFFRDPDGGPAGAVVSAASLGSAESAHKELVITIVIGCGGLLLGAAMAGFILAGRSLKPAADSLAQQEALLADAAHELRTPVATIRALLEAAQLDPAATQSAIEKARATSERMGDTLAALLAWGRLDAGTEAKVTTPLRLDQIVEDTAAEVLPPGVAHLTVSPTVVSGDPDLLRIAVRNLLDNALRHGGSSGDRGTIEVALSGGELTVADRGPGIPEEMLRNGFTRFESSSPGGMGLGISIVARIAELHEGMLTATNREGGGAVMRVTIPSASPRAPDCARGTPESSDRFVF